MKRSEKKEPVENGITISIKGALPLSSSPEETAVWKELRQGMKCRGFVLVCMIDSPDPGEPGFTLSHKVNLPEVAGAILQDAQLGAAAVMLAQSGMLITEMSEGQNDKKPN